MSTPTSAGPRDVRPGATVPFLQRTIRLVDMVAYAGATWDWHPIHYDIDAAVRIGASAPVVDGQMFGALLAEHLLDWLGPRARMRRMSFRLRAMVFAGETIRVEGEVREVSGVDGNRLVDVDQRVRVGDRIVVEGDSTAELVGR